MQHLVGYVESSGDEAEQAQSTTAPFQGAQGAAPKANANNNIVDGIGESDDEEAEQRANDKKSITSPHKTRGLPSADELLSAANASSWLAKPKWAMKPSEPTYVLLMRHLQKWVHRRITRPQTFAKKELPTADARDAPEYGDDMYQVYDPAKGWLGKQPTNFVDSAAGYGGPGVLTRNTNDDTARYGDGMLRFLLRVFGAARVHQRRQPQIAKQTSVRARHGAPPKNA